MNNIKLSAPDWCFYRDSFGPAEYYNNLRKLGYTGVEMVDSKRWPAAKTAGLEIVNISLASLEKGFNRTENHAGLIEEIRKNIELAKANNIPQIIVFSGNRQGQPDEAGFKNCVLGLKRAVSDAQKAGITLVFEMLNSYDHKDYQGDRSAYGFRLVKEVGSPALKVLYDAYHMFQMGEDILKDLTENLKSVAHIHVAESQGRSIPSMQGKIDYKTVVQKVQAAGYEGYWGMEYFPGENVMQSLQQAADLFRSF